MVELLLILFPLMVLIPGLLPPLISLTTGIPLEDALEDPPDSKDVFRLSNSEGYSEKPLTSFNYILKRKL